MVASRSLMSQTFDCSTKWDVLYLDNRILFVTQCHFSLRFRNTLHYIPTSCWQNHLDLRSSHLTFFHHVERNREHHSSSALFWEVGMFFETYLDHVCLATPFFSRYKQFVNVSMTVSLGLYSPLASKESVISILEVILSGCLLSLYRFWTHVFFTPMSYRHRPYRLDEIYLVIVFPA